MNKFINLVVLTFFISTVLAQVKTERSNKIIIIDGKKIYLHIVKAGQTLYSISKVYNVSQKNIYKENNIFTSGIKSGQVLKIPFITEGQSDKADYSTHKVEKGETLYSISRKYNVSINDIILHNSAAKYNINVGQIIKIPNLEKGNFEFQDDNYFYHTVISGESLFSLSQLYGSTIEQIKLTNSDAKKGLKVGQVLKISKINYDNTERLPISYDNTPNSNFHRYSNLYFESPNVTPCNRFVYNSSKKFNIALMLPFNLYRNTITSGEYEDEDDKLFYKNTRRFYEFYEGALVAVQQLKTQGLSLNLFVYDTENSPAKVKQIISKPEFSNIDLIIGPVYSKNIKIVGNFAKTHKINLISPLSKKNIVLKNNPFIFEVMPSDVMKIKKTSDFLCRIYDTCIVIVHNGSKKEKEKIDIYKKKLVKSFSSRKDIKEVVLKNINYNKGGISAIRNALSPGLKNIIIIPSNSEVFITKVIKNLHELTKKYEIILIGEPSWELHKNINHSYLKKLSFHYVSSFYIDYDNWRVKSFLNKYRDIYRTEPSLYAFEGYDIMNYFLNAIKQYGRNFQFCLSPYDKLPNRKGIIFDFNFERTGINNGFENNSIHILQYNENFKLEKTNK